MQSFAPVGYVTAYAACLPLLSVLLFLVPPLYLLPTSYEGFLVCAWWTSSDLCNRSRHC